MGIEIPPHVNDANRNKDLGVDYSLGGQVLHHAPGNEFVVFRGNQAARHGLEALNEAGEIVEAIEGFSLGWRDGLVVLAGAQFDKRGRRNGALEVQMQLSFGQAADEGFDF